MAEGADGAAAARRPPAARASTRSSSASQSRHWRWLAHRAPAHPGQDGVVEHRLRKFEFAGRQELAGRFGGDRGIQVEHLPGAAGVAQRRAVMDFTGIDGDDLPGLGLHLAASAVRGLRAMADHADAELFVRVACEGPVAARGTACTPARALRCMRNWLAGMERAAGRQGTRACSIARRAAHGKRPGGPRRLPAARPDGPQRRPCV